METEGATEHRLFSRRSFLKGVGKGVGSSICAFFLARYLTWPSWKRPLLPVQGEPLDDPEIDRELKKTREEIYDSHFEGQDVFSKAAWMGNVSRKIEPIAYSLYLNNRRCDDKQSFADFYQQVFIKNLLGFASKTSLPVGLLTPLLIVSGENLDMGAYDALTETPRVLAQKLHLGWHGKMAISKVREEMGWSGFDASILINSYPTLGMMDIENLVVAYALLDGNWEREFDGQITASLKPLVAAKDKYNSAT